MQQQTHCAKNYFKFSWERFTAGEKKRTIQAKRRGLEHSEGFEKCLYCTVTAGDIPAGNLKDNKHKRREEKGTEQRILLFYWTGAFSWISHLPPPGLTAKGEAEPQTTAGMKYNYHVPVSTYTRTSQYTPTLHTPTYYTPSHYTPTHYTSSYTSTTKYTPTQYSATHYTPSHYTSTYKTGSTYIPSYSKGSRYSSTQRTRAQENPAPVIPVTAARRTVHFPNDIIFQDIVRRGDLEQIGRFMRARKVRVDTLFHSGEQSLNSSYFFLSSSNFT